MASKSGTMYIGVTNDLIRRVTEHKQGIIPGFTKKYNCNKLIYYERYQNINDAINREKEIKKWRREKKIQLFEPTNPGWKDLFEDLL